MAWKHITRHGISYFVNLNEVAYLQQYEKTTEIIFPSNTGDGKNLSIFVDQSPQEILVSEEVT
jgi:hypothetical protein